MDLEIISVKEQVTFTSLCGLDFVVAWVKYKEMIFVGSGAPNHTGDAVVFVDVSVLHDDVTFCFCWCCVCL